jgi:hypothetical protein
MFPGANTAIKPYICGQPRQIWSNLVAINLNAVIIENQKKVWTLRISKPSFILGKAGFPGEGWIYLIIFFLLCPYI